MVTNGKGYTRSFIAIATVLTSSQSAKVKAINGMIAFIFYEGGNGTRKSQMETFSKVHELCKTTVGDP